MSLTDKYLTEAKTWKNDPYGFRDRLAEKVGGSNTEMGSKIGNIYISESLFFYDNNTSNGKKHIAEVGKKLQALDKAVSALESVVAKI